MIDDFYRKFIIVTIQYKKIIKYININIYDKYSDSEREGIDKIATCKINSYSEVLDILNKGKAKVLKRI